MDSVETFIESLFDDNGLFSTDDRGHEEDTIGDERVEQLEDISGNIFDEGLSENALNVDNRRAYNSLTSSSNRGEEVVCGDNEELRPVSDSEWFPKEGMVFEHVVEGFIKYSEYARRCGFEVRFRSSELSPRSRKVLEASGVEIPHRRRMSRGIGRNWLHDGYEFCSRVRLQCVKGETWRAKRCNIGNTAVRTQATNCKAGVNLQKNVDGNWEFRKVRLEHNHDCDPNTTRFMKSYRIVSGVDELQIVVGDRAGVTPARGYMNFVVGRGGIENVPFSVQDSHSVLRRCRLKGMENGDFNAMQKFFNQMKLVSEGFYYSYDTDVEGMVKNVLWADERSRAAFDDFGDVLCFDTTHLKNWYKMPLGLFIGVNHHGQSILLGCALVTKEDTESFKWVFETWLSCMGRRMPKYIMTDQCKAIGNAVGSVFPSSRHRWCLWHVMKNAELHLRKHHSWPDLRKDLADIVHCSCDPDEFEGTWVDFLSKYNMGEDKWLNDMYDVRERWVPAYFLNEFWAGMHSTQRSEGMNNFFRSYVNINTGLKQFAEQYALAVGKRVDDEEREDWRSKNKPIQCATLFKCEKVFQRCYTVRKFLEFQAEAKAVVYVNCELVNLDDDVRIHIVTDKFARKGLGRVGTREFTVSSEVESRTTRCSCKMFEFRGIVCRHIVAVWKIEDVIEVPSMYILDRWRKDRFRKSSVVKIPNHTHAFASSDEERRLRKLQSSMHAITSLAMEDESICDAVLLELQELLGNCKTMLEASEEGVRMDSVGRQHKRRGVVSPSDDPITELTLDHVLDPIDCRGKGRVPTHRKGYKRGNRKGSNREQGKKKADASSRPKPNNPKVDERQTSKKKGGLKGSAVLHVPWKKQMEFHTFL